VQRRGLGKGKGSGYHNIVSQDPYVHSLSAKGVKSQVSMNAPFHDDSLDFGKIPTSQKKGMIREIAQKAQEGVSWALQWEREHLPKQADWVKKEFKTAKEQLSDIAEKLKKRDMDDVRDELDTNDDGVQDIPIEELEVVNQQIHEDVRDIDYDNNGVPDYAEVDPPKGTKSAGTPLDYLRTNISSGVDNAKMAIEHHKEVKRSQKEELAGLTDQQLEELAVRNRGGLFGKSRYEKELLTRINYREKLRMKESEAKLKGRSQSDNKLLSSFKEVFIPKRTEKPFVKKKQSDFSPFGFINPVNTLKRKR